MQKYLKVFLVVFIIVVLFIMSFFGTGFSKYDSITFDEYKNLKGDNVVYIGKLDKVMDSLKDIKINKDYKLLYLDYSKLSNSEKKDLTSESVEVIKNGKKVDTYNFSSFDLSKNDKKMSLETVTADKYVKLIKEKGLHFMFVGSETCGHCINFKETIKELYKNYKIGIYYVDLSSASEDDYNKVIGSDSYFSNNEWGTPTSLIYYNGINLDVISGEVDVNTLVDALNNNIGIKVFLIDNKVM